MEVPFAFGYRMNHINRRGHFEIFRAFNNLIKYQWGIFSYPLSRCGTLERTKV